MNFLMNQTLRNSLKDFSFFFAKNEKTNKEIPFHFKNYIYSFRINLTLGSVLINNLIALSIPFSISG